MAFERVASLSDIPAGSALCVRVRGRDVGLFRVGDRVMAVDNVCPHAGYPLHEGPLEGKVVTCNGHGWDYDLETGLAPGVTGGERLERYPVRLESEEIWVDVQSPLRP